MESGYNNKLENQKVPDILFDIQRRIIALKNNGSLGKSAIAELSNAYKQIATQFTSNRTLPETEINQLLQQLDQLE